MSEFYVIDIRDFPPPEAPIEHAAARRLRDYLGSVIEAASTAPKDMVTITMIRCRRRPKRQPCPGRLVAVRDGETSEIEWRCRSCGEGGVIYNWRGTAWDRSGEPPPGPDHHHPGSYEDPEEATDSSGARDEGRPHHGTTPTHALAERFLHEAVARLGREPESPEELHSVIESLTGDYNRTPLDELGGLAPVQARELFVADWATPGGAVRLDDRLGLQTLARVRELANARTFLQALRDQGGTKATSAGNLNRRFVGAMLEAMVWPPGFREDLYLYNKVVNEQDAFPLHTLRVLLVLAGLVKARKTSFRITRRGEELLAESRAGELYAHIFRTQFRRMNLAYLDHALEASGFQHTLAYSLYRFGRVGDRWSKPGGFVPDVMLPAVVERIPATDYVDDSALILETRFLEPLERFGLAESREVPGKYPGWSDHEYRKTSLYDRFLTFDLPRV